MMKNSLEMMGKIGEDGDMRWKVETHNKSRYNEYVATLGTCPKYKESDPPTGPRLFGVSITQEN
jgi:hypothetical protein